MKRILYFLYQWLIAGPLFLVATILTASITIIGCTLGDRDFWGYWAPSMWSRVTCRLFLVKVIVRGRENIDRNTSYVFTANHQGAFDIWAIYGYLGHNFKWLMKKGLRKIFMIGSACATTGHIFVDDSSISGIRETIKDSEETLRDGMSLVIFPEGSRSWDGKMSSFKRGAFILAAEFGLPIVPMTIDGSYDRMPRFTYNMNPGKIILTIHKPITPDDPIFKPKLLIGKCREEIMSALPDKNRGDSSDRKPTAEEIRLWRKSLA